MPQEKTSPPRDQKGAAWAHFELSPHAAPPTTPRCRDSLLLQHEPQRARQTHTQLPAAALTERSHLGLRELA